MFAEFDLEMPNSLDEAVLALARSDGIETLTLAGGSSLMVDIRARRVVPERLISLARINELRRIEILGPRITIGSRTTVSDILRSNQVAEHGAALAASAEVFAGQMVRNVATVAGNIACGSPAADLVPPLLSLDADVVLTNASGFRTVPLADYFTGFKQDVRRPDELITAISWDVPGAKCANRFYKLARRKGDAITVTGVAVTLGAANGVCTKARVALGAVAPIVMRARAAEAMLEGSTLTVELIEEASLKAAEECQPIDDIRASADYRRHAVHMLTRRLVAGAWADLHLATEVS
ncbi:MAG: FAD binding domain-containing protein [Burkholderiales bacterium]|nr:FAD binding domain-containing protein [Burkholderiales bacterium]